MVVEGTIEDRVVVTFAVDEGSTGDRVVVVALAGVVVTVEEEDETVADALADKEDFADEIALVELDDAVWVLKVAEELIAEDEEVGTMLKWQSKKCQ